MLLKHARQQIRWKRYSESSVKRERQKVADELFTLVVYFLFAFVGTPRQAAYEIGDERPNRDTRISLLDIRVNWYANDPPKRLQLSQYAAAIERSRNTAERALLERKLSALT